MPGEFAKLALSSGGQEGDEEEKKRQKRGGKGNIKTNKKKEDDDKDRKVTVSRAPRGKKKSVTVVCGLARFGEFNDVTFDNCLIIFNH